MARTRREESTGDDDSCAVLDLKGLLLDKVTLDIALVCMVLVGSTNNDSLGVAVVLLRGIVDNSTDELRSNELEGCTGFWLLDVEAMLREEDLSTETGTALDGWAGD